jgi:hypothetical protein
MKVGDILRQIADLVDTTEETVAPETSPELTPADNSDGTDPATMVPPLQQKHELLKMTAGIDNKVDTFGQELDTMKTMAGIGEVPPNRDPRRVTLNHFRSTDTDTE